MNRVIDLRAIDDMIEAESEARYDAGNPMTKEEKDAMFYRLFNSGEAEAEKEAKAAGGSNIGW